MSGQERKLDAAEYVIGTLSAVERTAFEASIETDATTRDDVLFWERTFGALNASVAPEAPPKDLWDRLSASLPGDANDENGESGENGASDENNAEAHSTDEAVAKSDAPESDGPNLKVVSSNGDTKVSGSVDSAVSSAAIQAAENDANNLRRSVNRWRTWAIAASVAAVALAGVLINSPSNPLAPPSEQIAGNELGTKEYIAVVNANGDQPSLVINIDAATGNVTVRSIGVERPEGRSLEVWYVPDGQTPISVGLVGEGDIDLKNIEAKDGDLLAISVEPPGGSPTGVATGDVIYTGKLIENVNPK